MWNPERPMLKMHLQQSESFAGCGRRLWASEEYPYYAKIEEICKECLRHEFGRWITVDITL